MRAAMGNVRANQVAKPAHATGDNVLIANEAHLASENSVSIRGIRDTKVLPRRIFEVRHRPGTAL
jgi:hypothetical protein